MKKKLQMTLLSALVLAAASWLTACQNGGKNAADAGEADGMEDAAEVEMEGADGDETAAPDIVFTRLVSHLYDKNDGRYDIKCMVYYPTGGTNTLLVKEARKWIDEILDCTYERSERYKGDFADGQAMLDYYAERHKEYVYAEDLYDDTDFVPGGNYEDSIRVIAESDKYLTLFDDAYFFGAGAMHGVPMCYGVTLLKDNAQRVTWDMFTSSISRFQPIIKNGLRTYFQLGKNASLDEYIILVDDINAIPLPACLPILTAEGVKFIYQPYEIASYASGIPAFTVPYETIKPLMKQELQKRLGLSEE